jgi:EAL and modified HD-GYP domain-containing signal transduction protein
MSNRDPQLMNSEPEAAENVPAEWAGGLRYVARQPILDLRGRVHAYELLFRAGPETAFRGDGDVATRTMLDNTVMFGLDRLTAGLPAFVNCTREALTESLVDVLPPSMTVLEVLETLEPNPELIAACRQLKAAGFRLALDDFVWEPRFEPLIELANYIKVDIAATPAYQRRELMQRLKGKAIAMIAEKVETQQEYQQAKAEGFTLFQGYFFCRPILMKNRNIPANRLFHVQILQLLHKDPIDLHQLSDLLKKDTSLTYRLMRLVNSPICAMRQEVRSIETALVVVGEDAFRRIATLAVTSEMNSTQSMEILRMAFVRGRFCELAAGLCGLDSTEQYLMGMFSMLPAMLRVSIEDLAPSLPMREDIRGALIGQPLRERCLLQWVESTERGQWAECDKVIEEWSLPSEEIVRCYAEAITWSEEALQSVR